MNLTYIIIAVLAFFAMALVYQLVGKSDSFHPRGITGGSRKKWLWLFIPLIIGLLPSI
jgi:hypothetical protein